MRQTSFSRNRIIYRVCTIPFHTVEPQTIATFLGKKLHGNYQDDIGNRFNTRIEGACIRHTMGPASAKLYDKFGFKTKTSEYRLYENLPAKYATS
ncbi:MAG: hypothetical protein HRF42_02910 [Candidatus Brocadia sp.]